MPSSITQMRTGAAIVSEPDACPGARSGSVALKTSEASPRAWRTARHDFSANADFRRGHWLHEFDGVIDKV